MNFEQWVQEMVESIDDETPEIQALARAIATDAAVIAARALRGENVEAEIAHIKAQALNLTASAKEAVYNVVADFVAVVLERFLPAS